MALCERGMIQFVKKLATPVSVNIKDAQGRNSLFYSVDHCSNAKLQIIKVLFLNGVEWNGRDLTGVT